MHVIQKAASNVCKKSRARKLKLAGLYKKQNRKKRKKKSLIRNSINDVSQIVHHISLGADMWITDQAPLEDFMDIRKCANCRKEIDLDDKSSFTTIMHHQMHRYVCDNNKCMYEFYGYSHSNGVANNVINPTSE